MGRGAAPERPATGDRKKSLEASPELRALHTLAYHLKTTTGHLEQCLSAQEFTRWCVWLEAEQIGPEWDALRHAELLAALHNGPMKRADGTSRPFTVREFLRRDPWAPPPPTPDPSQQLLDRIESFDWGA